MGKSKIRNVFGEEMEIEKGRVESVPWVEKVHRMILLYPVLRWWVYPGWEHTALKEGNIVRCDGKDPFVATALAGRIDDIVGFPRAIMPYPGNDEAHGVLAIGYFLGDLEIRREDRDVHPAQRNVKKPADESYVVKSNRQFYYTVPHERYPGETYQVFLDLLLGVFQEKGLRSGGNGMPGEEWDKKFGLSVTLGEALKPSDGSKGPWYYTKEYISLDPFGLEEEGEEK